MDNSNSRFVLHQFSPSRSNGFTLLELALVIGIIAILSAIAIPAYLDYETRAKSAEPMTMLDTLREEVAIEVATRDGLLQCDDNLVDYANLKSPYMHMQIMPFYLDESDHSKGSGVGILLNASLGSHGVEGIQVTKTFYRELEKHQNEKIMPGLNVITDSVVVFNFLLSNLGESVCLAGAGPAQPQPQPAQTSTATAGNNNPSVIHAAPKPAVVPDPPKPTLKPGQVAGITDPAPAKGVPVCKGDICGLIPGLDPVKDCDESAPYAFTILKNEASGQKTYEKGCQNAEWCEANWWQNSSDRSECTNFDPKKPYTYPFNCSYCFKGASPPIDMEISNGTMYIGN